MTDDVGLYSISVRGFDVPSLLRWATATGIPFIHLRGGSRGYCLTSVDRSTLRSWRPIIRDTVPVTGVTADVDLMDVLARRPESCEEVLRLAEAAAELGAKWLRLCARIPPAPGDARGELPTRAVPLLIEPHHPGWLTPAGFAALPHVRLLADTRQLAGQPTMLGPAVERADVLHLSDQGEGLDTIVANLAARRIAAGQSIEVAVEWTGPDRSPKACRDRYRSACAWWRAREPR
ncbi:hypothetical protein Pth03_12050 [Planotetraspora thailandica]|uniref:Xylose isomerase-like TIM barrel domain-containing protein n=1 Tax=Planotetraspora thailandica TaxID=487172 RepID=A0A8J3V0I6_9ACTN|nr:hypothetical protein [Planotetraspora thailandica]GII52816.1 hypothetical protein Pth03_12050 [Planotetraspora thailandica]